MNFTLELRNGLWILVYKDGSCRPATSEEVELWEALVNSSYECNMLLEKTACICDEYGLLMSAEKDSALLAGKLELSNAMSGEPRAAAFLAQAIRQLKT